MTYAELCQKVMQKMFAAYDQQDDFVQDDLLEGYQKALPQAANEGIALLYAAGFFLQADVELDVEGETAAYDLLEQAEDFARLLPCEVRLEDGAVTDDYVLAGGHVFYPGASLKGQTLRVGYVPYPPALSEETQDGELIPLPNDAGVLLPLYVASQLYKEQDLSAAIQMRNEFDAAVNQLAASKQAPVAGTSFHNESGWY